MPLPLDYQKRGADEKLELLWSQIKADPYPDGALPHKVPGPWGRRKLFSVGFNKGSFLIESDELPEDRPKLVHTFGTTARVALKITSPQAYTGFFQAGGAALMRASDATGGGKFLPSLALKFFVDGRPSVNLLALPTQPHPPSDPRFFASAYANATLPATSFDAKMVQRSFQKTAEALGGKRLYAVYLPLHNVASVRRDGSSPSKAEVPDRVELHPAKEAAAAWVSTPDWRSSLAKIPVGTKIFDVRASPSIDADATPLGEVWLEAPFVASRYGDERLFFQHDVGPT